MPEGSSIPIDCSLPCDRNILSVQREDKVTAVGIPLYRRPGMVVVVVRAGTSEKNGSGFEMKRDAAAKHKAAGEKYPWWKHHHAAPCIVSNVNSALQGSGIQRAAIASCPKIADIDKPPAHDRGDSRQDSRRGELEKLASAKT